MVEGKEKSFVAATRRKDLQQLLVECKKLILANPFNLREDVRP